MKRRTLAVLACVASICAGNALADARVTFGFHFGVPFYWGAPYYYYPYPYYPAPIYYPPPVVYAPSPVISAPPPTLVERPAEPSYWYYCASSRGYYPYARECPEGWQRVPSAPPSARQP